MNDDTYTTAVTYDDRVPPDAKAHYRQRAREQCMIGLLELLYKPGHPIYTISIHDDERPAGDFPFMRQEYRVWAEISPVEQRHVVIAEFPKYDAMPLRELSTSALGEIKRRVKRQLKGLFGWVKRPGEG